MNRMAVCLVVLAHAACGRHDDPSPVAVPVVPAASTAPEIAVVPEATPPAPSAAEREAEAAPISDADKVVASLRPKFRGCYKKGLEKDPTLAGKVIFAARVDATGAVTSIDTSQHDGLTPEVIDCMTKVMQGARFSAPGGGGAMLNVPVKFVQQ